MHKQKNSKVCIDETIQYEIPEKYIKIRQSSYVPFIYTIVVIHSSYQSTIFHASVSIIGEIPLYTYTAKKPQGKTFLYIWMTDWHRLWVLSQAETIIATLWILFLTKQFQNILFYSV